MAHGTVLFMAMSFRWLVYCSLLLHLSFGGCIVLSVVFTTHVATNVRSVTPQGMASTSTASEKATLLFMAAEAAQTFADAALSIATGAVTHVHQIVRGFGQKSLLSVYVCVRGTSAGRAIGSIGVRVEYGVLIL